ncbi:MAG: amidohydrolase family protein [Planctomycetes bacterium]|nr:amidohydrolase family protein [Planctomycetota bacterium]
MIAGLQAMRGPLLNPSPTAGVDYFADGVLVGDDRGRIVAVGAWDEVSVRLNLDAAAVPRSMGLIMPPLLDAHIHIPQHPIRGRFAENIGADPPGGRLLASLEQNVFPAEGRCEGPAHARHVVADFLTDTLASGVIGGAAYMTVHPRATRIALEQLPEPWSVGLVLMNGRCPAYLRTDEQALADDVTALAHDFGRRLIVTDRFAVSVDTPLRTRGVALARRHGLRMQTHLDEQRAEKALIEEVLYPEAGSYTGVYARDGLLDCEPILAHCIHMRPEEVDLIAATASSVAHCPVSNTLLGSGVMPLDVIRSAGIPHALCTDVGASPTTSLFCEMAQFLKVHAGSSSAATPEEALRLVTVAPARMLGVGDRVGTFAPGMEWSFIEVACEGPVPATAREAILGGLLLMPEADLEPWRSGDGAAASGMRRLRDEGLDWGHELAVLDADVRATAARLEGRVRRVTRAGKVVWPPGSPIA